MSRPATIYLIMVLVLIVGLWVVLHNGARLSAPEDLAGKWQLQSNIRGIPNDELTIEQSGLFFQVAFNSGPKLDLKMTEHAGSVLQLTNTDTKLTVSGAPGSDDKMVELSGSAAGRWIAHRSVRTYPSDVSAQERH